MNKEIWITSFEDESVTKSFFNFVSKYCKNVNGNFWQGNLDRMEWASGIYDLTRKEIGLWIIFASSKSLEKKENRYGLSLLSLSVQNKKGHLFPAIIVSLDEIKEELIPTPLKSAERILLQNLNLLKTKILTKLNINQKKYDLDYIIDIHPLPGLGQWFEVGPGKNKKWEGVIFGVLDAQIDFCGVGERGKLPEKSIINYLSKNMKIQMRKEEYTAWMVLNNLIDNLSFYVKVKDFPKAIVFGQAPKKDEGSVFNMVLK